MIVSKVFPDFDITKLRLVFFLLFFGEFKSRLIIKTIEETWKSKEMEFFRDIHKKGEFWKHSVCKKCVLSTSHVEL